MRPDAEDQVFLHLRTRQTEPTRAGRLSWTQVEHTGSRLLLPHALLLQVGLTVPARLFVLSVLLLVASFRGSLPATAPRTAALLPAQVEEELVGRLLERKAEDFKIKATD